MRTSARRFRQGLVAVMLSLMAAVVSADALIVVCYNWGCLAQQPVSFSEPWLRKALQPLRQAKTPEAERAAVAEVVHRFYLKAAEQTPIAADEAGNDEDITVNGRMDCIDHSTTTKNILSYLQHRKLLRWHVVGPYAHRTLILGSHYSATLVETDVDADDDRQIYTVDPWDVEPVQVPPVSPVREWASYRFYSLETQHHITANTAVARP
mgnify:CR=1 FL=1